ncbi:MAG: hypothetical protein ACRDG5_11620 [Anaerolineales bacterium]
MRDGVGPVLLIALGAICLIALFVALGAFFPRRIERTRREADGSPGRSFLIGLVNTVFLVALIVALQGAGSGMLGGVLRALVFALAALAIVAATFGLASMVELAGERLFPKTNPMPRTIGGAAVMILACLTPYLGWFGFFPYVALRGLGAFLLGWWTGRGEAAAG